MNRHPSFGTSGARGQVIESRKYLGDWPYAPMSVFRDLLAAADRLVLENDELRGELRTLKAGRP